MGAAEVGRELGDAGGPLLVGATAAALTINWGLAALALTLIVAHSQGIIASSPPEASR